MVNPPGDAKKSKSKEDPEQDPEAPDSPPPDDPEAFESWDHQTTAKIARNVLKNYKFKTPNKDASDVEAPKED